MAPIKLASWNMEWLNNLFESGNGPARFKPDDAPALQDGNDTVGQRKALLSRGLHHLDADVMVIVEGPNRTAELQLLFDTLAPGQWKTFAQVSKSPNGPNSTSIWSSSQCTGIALRTDRDRLAPDPLRVFDAMDPASGAIHAASEPFFMDIGQDKIPEWFRFERRPAYAEITLKDGKVFRLVGLHLKSKGIFKAYEWSRYWSIADANRERLLAQCRHLREKFLDPYLTEAATRDIPLVVCGDINDGPGFDTSEMRLKASAVETLMGSVWMPRLALGNALFDTLPQKDKDRLNFEDLSTTSFADPIFNHVYQRVWIDHILYSRHPETGWISGAQVVREIPGPPPLPYYKISDHYPVTAEITL